MLKCVYFTEYLNIPITSLAKPIYLAVVEFLNKISQNIALKSIRILLPKEELLDKFEKSFVRVIKTSKINAETPNIVESDELDAPKTKVLTNETKAYNCNKEADIDQQDIKNTPTNLDTPPQQNLEVRTNLKIKIKPSMWKYIQEFYEDEVKSKLHLKTLSTLSLESDEVTLDIDGAYRPSSADVSLVEAMPEKHDLRTLSVDLSVFRPQDEVWAIIGMTESDFKVRITKGKVDGKIKFYVTGKRNDVKLVNDRLCVFSASFKAYQANIQPYDPEIINVYKTSEDIMPLIISEPGKVFTCSVAHNKCNVRVTATVGNLLEETVDAIVNPIDSRWEFTGSVSQAILEKTGQGLIDELKKLLSSDPSRNLKSIHCICTSGHLPKINNIIHVVVPRLTSERILEQLTATFLSCFIHTHKINNNITSIAVPAIGSGIIK